MEPLVSKKRHISTFIPYRKVGGDVEFYLQKRDAQAPVHANIFSLFGGGLDEGEEPQSALLREVKEELNYEPTQFRYFSRFESGRGIFYVYIEAVGEDFESLVDVQEGEYGKFLKFSEIAYSEKVSDIAQMMTRAIKEFIEK